MPARACHVELPAVIGTFDPPAIKTSERERHGSVWTKVEKRRNAALEISTDDNRHAEKRLCLHCPRFDFGG
jgi:hypothetical protein